MKFLLFLIAIVLFIILTPLGLLFSLITRLFVWRFKGWRKKLGEYFYICALSIDQTGNVFCADLLDAALIHKDAEFKFGNPDQTISAVLGYNQYHKTLTGAGKLLVKILDTFDEAHCESAMLMDTLMKIAAHRAIEDLHTKLMQFEEETNKQKEDELKQKPNTRRGNKISNREKARNRQYAIKRRNSKPKTDSGEDLSTNP
jgi:hypothetical protein